MTDYAFPILVFSLAFLPWLWAGLTNERDGR